MLHATIANILSIFRWVTLLAVDQKAPMPLQLAHQAPDKPDGLHVFVGVVGPVGRERVQLHHPVHGHDGVDLAWPAVGHAAVAKHRSAPSAMKVCDVAIARLQCNPMCVG
jgi:hypothetical protein